MTKLSIINRYKFIILILTSLFILNSGVYVLLYFSSLKVVKKTIHYLIEKDQLEDELIVIAISKTDIEKKLVSFEWVEDKEFRYNDNMYDVKKDLSTFDSLKFLCYLDTHENLLEQLFSKFRNSHDNKNFHHNKLVIVPFLGLYYQQSDNHFFAEEILFSINIKVNLISILKEVLTPPPQTEFNFS